MPTIIDRIWVAIYLVTILILVAAGFLGVFTGWEFVRGALILAVSGVAIAHVWIVWRVPFPAADDDLRARHEITAVDHDRDFSENKNSKNKK